MKGFSAVQQITVVKPCLCLSFSWTTSRMDRNMITVMTGQVVDFFDRDFRELYAVSDKMNLYKEFHVSPPAANKTATLRSKAGPKRPPLPATTSRFQVSLGDSRKADIQVPAHKFYNPKYSLVFGDNPPRPTGSLQEPGPKRKPTLAEVLEEPDPDQPRVASSDKTERMSPLAEVDPIELFKKPNGVTTKKEGRRTLKVNWNKLSSKDPSNNLADSTSSPSKEAKKNSSPAQPHKSPATDTNKTEESEDSFEVIVKTPSKWKSKRLPKMGRRAASEQAVNTAPDNESKSDTSVM